MTSVLRVQVSPSALPSTPPAPQTARTAAIVLVCNGPGELATWVRPLAQRLHRELALRPLHPGSPLSLDLVLVPCPNATGSEHRVAERIGATLHTKVFDIPILPAYPS